MISLVVPQRRKLVPVSMLVLSLLVTPETNAEGNPYGVVSMLWIDYHTSPAARYIGLMSDLVGDWGHTRHGIRTESIDVEYTRRGIVLYRAHRIIPICVGGNLPNYLEGGDGLPLRDPDGTYTTVANYYRTWLQAHNDAGIYLPYMELHNEVNHYWEAEAYAQFLYDVAVALKSVDPSMGVSSAGMAGSGSGYYDRMLTAKPELIGVVDYWGCHPYASNHPPSHPPSGTSIRGFENTAAVLRSHGVANPRLLLTETGWELGDHTDPTYPEVTEELRAAYAVEAFRDWWAPSADVWAVTPFEFGDLYWGTWGRWDWIRYDWSLTPQYEAVAALPKPPGSDWLATGTASVVGSITNANNGGPVEDAFVYLTPGLYAAKTDQAGSYVIAGVPAGTYTSGVFRSAFSGGGSTIVTLTDGETAVWDTSLHRTGMVSDGFDSGTRIAPGWIGGNPAAFVVDYGVKRSGAASQRVAAGAGGTYIWRASSYFAVLPDHAYSVEVWVKSQNLVIGGKTGPTIRLEYADSFGTPIGSTECCFELEGTHDWTPMQVTMAAAPLARRIRVALEVRAESGTVWWDDVFLDDASLPLPGNWNDPPATQFGQIQGRVIDFRGDIAPASTVSANPGNHWAVCDPETGHYSLDAVPVGRYDLWARAPDLLPATTHNVQVTEGGISEVNFQFEPPLLPRQPNNPGFEIEGMETQVVVGWRKYGQVDGVEPGEDGTYFASITAHEGIGFLGTAASYNQKEGGVYQQLTVDDDREYRLSAHTIAYRQGGQAGDVVSKIGIDPTGGIDAYAPSVTWSEVCEATGEFDTTWYPLEVTTTTQGTIATIFLHHTQKNQIAWHINCYDAVVWETFDPAATPTPAFTPTPSPTVTPTATPTPFALRPFFRLY